MKGIDISSGSGGVDFRALKNDGYQFVIARAGWGSSITQKDSRFDEYVRAALDAGMHVGAYWFIYCRSVEEARENARCFAEVLKPFSGRLDMPVYIDYEYDSTRYYNETVGGETRELATAFIDQSAQVMESMGYYTGVYLNPDYIKNHINLDQLRRYTLWLAEWKDSTKTPSYDCALWQYAGDTRTPYASGGIDLDVCFQTDFPTIIRSGGFNGFPKDTTPSDDVPSDHSTFFGHPVVFFEDGTWRKWRY